MNNYKTRIPRKLKKACKRLVVLEALPKVRHNSSFTKLTVVMGSMCKLKYGKHNKWTQLAVCKITNEIIEKNKRIHRTLFELGYDRDQ